MHWSLSLPFTQIVSRMDAIKLMEHHFLMIHKSKPCFNAKWDPFFVYCFPSVEWSYLIFCSRFFYHRKWIMACRLHVPTFICSCLMYSDLRYFSNMIWKCLMLCSLFGMYFSCLFYFLCSLVFCTLIEYDRDLLLIAISDQTFLTVSNLKFVNKKNKSDIRPVLFYLSICCHVAAALVQMSKL